MQLEFYPLDVTYRERKDGVDIILFGRDAKGKKYCVKDSSFEPFFYAKANAKLKEKIEKIEVEGSKVKKVLEVEKNIHGKKTNLLRIYGTHPKDIPKLRNEIKDAVEETYEYDIKFTRRYLLDRKILPLNKCIVEGEKIEDLFGRESIQAKKITPTQEPLDNLNVLAIDIETYGKTYDPQNNPILMIALYGKKFKKIVSWGNFEAEHLEQTKDEKAMLLRINELINEYNPDVITGYYSDAFDLPYIQTRVKKHKIDFKIHGSEIKVDSGRESTASILGVAHIDLLRLIRKTVGRGLETSKYSLDQVANEVLGDQKKVVDLDELSESWDKKSAQLSLFADYNLHDTYLTYELFYKFLPQLEEMVRVVGLTPFDVNRMAYSQLVEWFIIKQTNDYNELIQNKPDNSEIGNRKHARLKGGFVFEPKPGVYKNVLVFDFRSLYPTIIVSHNISPSALGVKDKERFVNPENDKIWFSKNIKGFISSILEELILRRAEVKAELKKKDDPFLEARSQTLKLMANSFYGYLGFYAARWYCFPCAETITAFARHYIQDAIKKFGKEGMEVIYSDTDSVFVSLKNKKQKEAKDLVKKINDSLPGMMELEFEGHYPSGIFVGQKSGVGGAKKRYCLIDDKDKLKITGFEAVRRNVSVIAKEVQEEVLMIILKEHDTEKAVEYVKKMINQIRAKKTPNVKLVIETRLSRELEGYSSVGPHVKVAREMEKKGKTVGHGSTIRYIISDVKGKVIREKAKEADSVLQGDYDSEYYVNNQIVPAVENIFAVLNVKKEDLLGEARQKTLGSFS